MKEIQILAMGPTWGMCPDEHDDDVELWGVNTTFRKRFGKPLDRLFCMHDLRLEILTQNHNFVNEINESGLPFYTAGDYPVFENNRPYPIKEIYEEFGMLFFLNTMSYMLALAITEKPEYISLYGVDMRPDSGMEHHQNEKGCVEFWLGVAIGRGIKIRTLGESSLLRRQTTSNSYGYRQRPEPNGLVHLIPENDQRHCSRFKLTPVDDQGKEVGKSVIMSRGHAANPDAKVHEVQAARGEAQII